MEQTVGQWWSLHQDWAWGPIRNAIDSVQFCPSGMVIRMLNGDNRFCKVSIDGSNKISWVWLRRGEIFCEGIQDLWGRLEKQAWAGPHGGKAQQCLPQEGLCSIHNAAGTHCPGHIALHARPSPLISSIHDWSQWRNLWLVPLGSDLCQAL